MNHIWRLFRLVPGIHWRLFRVVLISTVLGFAGLITPFVYKRILDILIQATQSGFQPHLLEQVLIALGILLGIGTIASVFNYISERISDLLFLDVNSEIRQRIYAHLSTLSIDYYEQTRAGEILERMNQGVGDFARWVSILSEGMLGRIIMMTLVLGFLWIKLPAVGLLMTISLPLSFYWAVSKVIQTKPLRRQQHQHAERANGEAAETINHIATVRSFAQETYRQQRFEAEIAHSRTFSLSQMKIEWQTNFYRSLANWSTEVIAIGIVALGILHGQNTAGDLLLVSLYLQQLQSSIMPLSRLIIHTGNVETSAERIVELLDVEPTIRDRADAKTLRMIRSIEFRGVSFHYPKKDRLVLEAVSFRLDAGKTLALVGPSGVGKTTITKLLLRFYEPTAGTILINDEPIEHFTQQSIRALIGMVMQDVALFNDTIEENLRFSRPKATRVEIKQAAQIAHADTFIHKLPEGYKTLVGERGIKLSGGEKQRVAIARAILRNPQLIVLDEATSALDSESERLVQDGLHKLLQQRTAIIIAHRLSTVQKADQILVLDKGRVAQQGTHAELGRAKGLYARLLSLQGGFQA